jgi:hypothetical protein
VQEGLMRQEAIVTEHEAQWIMVRLADLLDWFETPAR